MGLPCKNCGFMDEIPSVHVIEAEDQTCDLHEQLQQLDCEITRAQALVEGLQRRRIAINKKMNRIYSPIIRLPPEVSAEIFLACVPDFDVAWDRLEGASMIPNAMTPLFIGMVCSTWREIAWSIPRLWSNISVSLEKSTPSSCELIKEWLARSGQCQMSVHLGGNPDREEISMYDSATLDVIAGSSDRWFKIFFSLQNSCYGSVLESICDHLPVLTFMSIRLERASWSTTFCGFTVTPQLRNVQIDGYCGEAMDLSPNQFTHLSLSWITNEECLDMLKRCTHLSHCTFKDIVNSHPPLIPVLAPKIEYLELVSESGNQTLGELLDALTIPLAHELRIDNHGASLPYSSFLSLISRSACDLQRFSLCRCPLSHEQLFLCLQAVPSVTDFEFSLRGAMDAVIWILDGGHTSNARSPCVLPNLRTLKLQGGEYNLSSLASMLLVRWRNDRVCSIDGGHNPSVQLQSVTAVIQEGIVPNGAALSQLQRLVAEGMEITLITGSEPRRSWL